MAAAYRIKIFIQKAEPEIVALRLLYPKVCHVSNLYFSSPEKISFRAWKEPF